MPEDELPPIPEPYNVRLPGGHFARLANRDEIARGQRRAIQVASNAASAAIIDLQRRTRIRLQEILDGRSPEEVALDFDFTARTKKLTAAEKTDFTARAKGTGQYRELPAAEREEASARLELDRLHARLTAEDREKAQDILDAISLERATIAESVAQSDLTDAQQDALYFHQAVRVFAFLREWSLDGPIPEAPEGYEAIPDTTFDALFMACREEALEELDTEHSARSLNDPKAPGGDSTP